MAEALVVNALLALAGMLFLWRVAVRIGDVSFIDAVWGGGMGVLGLASWLQALHPSPRATLVMAMTLLWGARLALHLYTRWKASGEDPRYAKILGKAKARGYFASAALKRVFGPQAVLLFVTCLPAQLGVLASGSGGIGPLAMAGAALWLIGMVFETVGDLQLRRFRADPASAGKVLDTGLWRYTRHPNYFGDTCVWWGIWLASAEAGWPVALAGLVGPVFVTFTLTRWSGKPMLEAGMAERRPGYADYVKRTSGFVPMPPKRG